MLNHSNPIGPCVSHISFLLCLVALIFYFYLHCFILNISLNLPGIQGMLAFMGFPLCTRHCARHSGYLGSFIWVGSMSIKKEGIFRKRCGEGGHGENEERGQDFGEGDSWNKSEGQDKQREREIGNHERRGSGECRMIEEHGTDGAERGMAEWYGPAGGGLRARHGQRGRRGFSMDWTGCYGPNGSLPFMC